MRRMTHAAIATCLLCAVLAAGAQESPPGSVDRVSGTLKKIKDSGVVFIGHRENSMPFSFLDDAKRPVGYSIDLCLAIVEDVADELGAEELRVAYRPVTPENRFDARAGRRSRPRMRIIDGQCRAAQVGRLFADDLRHRYEAACPEGQFHSHVA